MLNDFISTLEKVAFFNTSAFGIVALVLVGASWCLVGAIAGKAPKLGYRMDAIYLVGGAVSAIFIGVLCIFTGVGQYSSNLALFLSAVAFFLGGAGCFFQGVAMSHAMQSGPNGIIWAIIQSAMIFPFIFSVLFYDVKLTIMRGAGIAMMLASLILFASAKDNSTKSSGAWKIWTFAALVVVGLEQIITSIPFYYEECKNVSSLFSIGCMMLGYVAMALIVICCKRGYISELKVVLRQKKFWIYNLALLPLAALIAVIFQIPGMRAMANNGLGGMSFPVLVGSCIAAFTLYSVIVLKEKFKALDLIALVSCVTGMVLLCI